MSHRASSPTAALVTATVAGLLAAYAVLVASPAPLFEEAGESSGLVFLHQSSKTELKYLPETMSGGVAIFDFDNDGLMDVFFVNGAKLTAPQPEGAELDKSDPKFWNRLFRNLGNGKFVDVTEKYGVQGRGYGMGVAVGDYDNDGYPDLLVTNHATGNQNAVILYHNERGEKFTDVTARSGLKTTGWATSAGFFDYDRDGHLDLFICRYVKWGFALDTARRCGLKSAGGRSYCHPDEFEPISNYLFRNNGDGTFTDVSGPSGIGAAQGKGLGVAFADFNSDGWPDISVANDSVRQFLFKNNGNSTFSEVAMNAGAAFDEDGKDFGGMGTEFVDLDDDGWPDILTTTISLQAYAYFRNLGGGQFEYRTRATNLGRITQPYTGWGLRVFDFDNDGQKDVFFANGHVMDNIELSQPHLRYLQPPLLLHHSGTRFLDVSADAGEPFRRPQAGRGAAVGDLDNDGYLDIVVSNCGGRAVFARNRAQASGNNWIALRLRGRKSNRDGLGAKLVLTRKSGREQHAIASTAASYLSSQDPRVFFGLGKDDPMESIRISWPSGAEQIIRPQKVNQILTVEEETATKHPRE